MPHPQQQIQLNSFDLSIFIAYMVLAVGLGFVVSMGRKKTTRGYFLGGKTLPWYVIASSMLASDVSSEHFIANAGSGYTYGIVSATASWNCWGGRMTPSPSRRPLESGPPRRFWVGSLHNWPADEGKAVTCRRR